MLRLRQLEQISRNQNFLLNFAGIPVQLPSGKGGNPLQHFITGITKGADAGAPHDDIRQGAGHFVAYSIRDLSQNLAISVECFGQGLGLGVPV